MRTYTGGDRYRSFPPGSGLLASSACIGMECFRLQPFSMLLNRKTNRRDIHGQLHGDAVMSCHLRARWADVQLYTSP